MANCHRATRHNSSDIYANATIFRSDVTLLAAKIHHMRVYPYIVHPLPVDDKQKRKAWVAKYRHLEGATGYFETRQDSVFDKAID